MSGFRLFHSPSEFRIFHSPGFEHKDFNPEAEFLVVGRIYGKCPNCEKQIPNVVVCPECSYDLSKGFAPENLSEDMKSEVRSYMNKKGFGAKTSTENDP